VIALSLLMSSVIYAVPGVLEAPRQWPSLATTASVVALALVCTALAFGLFFALTAEVGAVRTTLITYINPAVAVVAGAVVLDERVTWATVAGFVLVVGGSALASGRRRAEQPEPPPPAACPPEPGPDLAAQRATMGA
jgi:drug/metabolite transporter (DMT)-like permease